jgi:hypothetical protein
MDCTDLLEIRKWNFIPLGGLLDKVKIVIITDVVRTFFDFEDIYEKLEFII